MQLPRLLCRLATLLACTAVLAQDPGKFDDPPAAFTLDQALAAVASYQPGDSRQPVNALDREVMQATATPATRTAMSARLTALLADPASTPMCRKLVCHQWLPLVAGDEALPVLKTMLASAGQEQTALDALARLPGEAAAAVLLGVLANPEPKVRDMAAEICGFRGDAAAVPALIALAGQSPAAVRAAARRDTQVAAVVACGGLVDRAGLEALNLLRAPLLFLYSGENVYADKAWQRAQRHLSCPHDSQRLPAGAHAAPLIAGWLEERLTCAVCTSRNSAPIL